VASEMAAASAAGAMPERLSHTSMSAMPP
jgi:hypothetical protein